jgi:hypothetical protein
MDHIRRLLVFGDEPLENSNETDWNRHHCFASDTNNVIKSKAAPMQQIMTAQAAVRLKC